ncbi:hypothetical protein CRG98_040744 [Punica granatum]|uniref:Retrotransposon gag domain-containing protein n=1 Tax=Punica granatum TaxID=22663 RepID=A0A2I0I4Y0_PUNGR|nr:hypothetical protein CRG98_040744 [Punica granatum]
MEETIKALQEGNSPFDYSDNHWNLFTGMRLPPKIKIPDFKRYDGTRDPRHHLRHYQSKMLPYRDYEEFVNQTFQDSLMGSALDWFMNLKASDIPTWTDLSQKFLNQYRFWVETPPTLLDLSMMVMRESQTFEAYATEWRGKAAKHNLIEAGKKLDMGVMLGRIEGPSRKKDGEESKKQTATKSRKSKDATVGAVNSGHQAPQSISVDYTPALQTSQAYAHLVHYTQLYPAQQAYSPTLPIII